MFKLVDTDTHPGGAGHLGHSVRAAFAGPLEMLVETGGVCFCCRGKNHWGDFVVHMCVE